MERKKQIELALEPLLLEQLQADTHRLMKSIEHRADFIIGELSDVISVALAQAALHQRTSLKGPIAYISFSLLLSNILTDRHGFQVAVFDDSFFMDTQEAIADWRPNCIFAGMQQCFDAAASIVKQQIPRLQPYELVDPEHAFSLNYYGIAMEVLIHALPRVFETISISALKKADKVQVVTGPYMEKQDCIYTWG